MNGVHPSPSPKRSPRGAFIPPKNVTREENLNISIKKEEKKKEECFLGDITLVQYFPRKTKKGNLAQKIEIHPENITIDVLIVFYRNKVKRKLRIQQGNKVIFVPLNGKLIKMIEESITQDIPEYAKSLRRQVMIK